MSAPTSHAEPARETGRRSLWHPVSVAMIALMAVGSVVMWIGVPLGLVFLASKLADSAQPSLGPYLVVFLGLPVGMFVVGKLLGRLDRAHGHYVGIRDDRPEQTVWMRSMRGERQRRRQGSVLDVVMLVSVGLALAALAVWFFGFAGSSLPT